MNSVNEKYVQGGKSKFLPFNRMLLGTQKYSNVFYQSQNRRELRFWLVMPKGPIISLLTETNNKHDCIKASSTRMLLRSFIEKMSHTE